VTGPDQRRAEPPGTARQPVRPHFTGRAAVLAIVLCAIALSLAYPVREYISQRRQIDQLVAQGAQIQLQLQRLQSERKLLHSPVYIAQQARDRLHMCLPSQMCYEIIGRSAKPTDVAARIGQAPWYAKLWSSVQQANAPQGNGQAEPARRRHVTRTHHGSGAHRA
jgi:cell division protein FtsB